MKDVSEKLFGRQAFIIVALLLVICTFLSVIIPPLQSPDEHDHIERAYLLSKGTIILDRPQGKSSGGGIDTGLIEYLTSYLPVKNRLSLEDIDLAAKITWTKNRIYDSAPGTAYYFPLIYLPQSTGLFIGEQLGLTIDHSYRLARAFSLLATSLIILIAFRLYPANPLLLALIAMPMSLFQFSSASLDGISTALTIFSISAFLRIVRDKQAVENWIQYALAVTITILTTSRVHTIPLISLLGVSYFYTKNNKILYLFLISLALTIIWTISAVITTVDLRVDVSNSGTSVIAFYLQHPYQLAKVLWSTISNPALLIFYYKTFIGILGWLDAEFGKKYYLSFGILLFLITALTISWTNIKSGFRYRILLALTALASIFFIFLALLVSWTPHPAVQVTGVQGRYFLIPAILFCYAIAGNRETLDTWQKKYAMWICLLFLLFSVVATTNLLLHRYYI